MFICIYIYIHACAHLRPRPARQLNSTCFVVPTARLAKLLDKPPRSQPVQCVVALLLPAHRSHPKTDRDGENMRAYDAYTNYNST